MDGRIPEAFFTLVLATTAARLLRSLSPPATGVVLTHLDAPGWVVVDLDEPRRMRASERESGPPLAWPANWLGPCLDCAAPSQQRDADLRLAASDDGERIWWQWEPAKRSMVMGWFPRDPGWPELRRLVLQVGPELGALLTYV